MTWTRREVLGLAAGVAGLGGLGSFVTACGGRHDGESVSLADEYELDLPSVAPETGPLPPTGEPVIAGIRLPPGSPKASELGEELIWVTDHAIDDRELWVSLAAVHRETGLWPVLVEDLPFEPGRPWESGEFGYPPGSRGESYPADVAEIFGLTWSSTRPDGDPEGMEWWRQSLGDWVSGPPSGQAATPGEVDSAAVVDVLSQLEGRSFGLVAARRASDVPRVVRTGAGIHYDISGDTVSTVVASWEERYGTILIGIGFDTFDLAVGRVEDVPWDEHAAEVFGIAPDVVTQGTGSIDGLAALMESSGRIQLWWD